MISDATLMLLMYGDNVGTLNLNYAPVMGKSMNVDTSKKIKNKKSISVHSLEIYIFKKSSIKQSFIK